MPSATAASKKAFSFRNWGTGLLAGTFLTTSMSFLAPDFAQAATNDNSTQQQMQQPAKSKAHKEEKRIVTLENGLTFLIVRDPEAEKAMVSLGVGVGQLHEWRPGLAHDTEHMLFLGTGKYPQPDTLFIFLNQFGGISNAFTAPDKTVYMYNVREDGLEKSLDIFSDYFKMPAFNTNYAEKEIESVNNEDAEYRGVDGWRIRRAQDLMSEPGHTKAEFHVGNGETLASISRKELLKFWKTFYSAKIMKGAIISTKPLDEMEKLVRSHFSGIPGFDVTLPTVDPQFRKPLKDAYRLLQVKTIKDMRQMTMEFPTINLPLHRDSRPEDLIGTVLGNEGPGSLLSRLKEDGLALGVSAGGGSEHPAINSMAVNIALTEKGMQEYERVAETVFTYIDMLRQEGIRDYVFDETKTMAQINFDWKPHQKGISYASNLVSEMMDYGLDHFGTRPHLFEKLDASAVKAVLNTMTPENMMITLAAKNVETSQVEKYYGVEYSIEQIGGASFERLKNARYASDSGIAYPAKNPFMPEKLELAEEKPHLVMDNEMGQIWAQFDNSFREPKFLLTLLLETPSAYSTPENVAKAVLYQVLIEESGRENAYQLAQAGLEYGFAPTKEGFILKLGGYTDRRDDLVAHVAKTLSQITSGEDEFENIKDFYVRSLSSEKASPASARGGYYFKKILNANGFHEEDILAAMSKLTLQDIRDYSQKAFERVRITGVADGNWNDADILKSVNALTRSMNSRPLPENERFKKDVATLERGEKISFSQKIQNENNAILYTIQPGKADPKSLAAVTLLNSIVSMDVFTQLRTEQQLGYLVQSFAQKTADKTLFGFVIQSNRYSPFLLQERIEGWMKERGVQIIEALNDEEFENFRQNEIQKLLTPPDSLWRKHAKSYMLATEEKGDFDATEKYINAYRQITKEDVIALAKEVFTGNMPKLIVPIRGSKNNDPVPGGVITCDNKETNGNAERAAWVRSRTCPETSPSP